MLVRFDMRVTLQLPDARIGVGRRQDPGLFVRDYAVFRGVDDEERNTLIRELRGILFGTTSQGSKSGKSLPASRIAGRRGLPKRTNSGISPFRRIGRSAYPPR